MNKFLRRLRRITYTIEQSFIILCPGHRSEFHLFQFFRIVFTRFHISNANGQPIRSARAQTVRKILSIVRKCCARQCDRTVRRQLIWIQENGRFSIECRLFVQHRLILQSRICVVEVIRSVTTGCRVLGIIPHRCQF